MVAAVKKKKNKYESRGKVKGYGNRNSQGEKNSIVVNDNGFGCVGLVQNKCASILNCVFCDGDEALSEVKEYEDVCEEDGCEGEYGGVHSSSPSAGDCSGGGVVLVSGDGRYGPSVDEGESDEGGDKEDSKGYADDEDVGIVHPACGEAGSSSSFNLLLATNPKTIPGC